MSDTLAMHLLTQLNRADTTEPYTCNCSQTVDIYHC